MKLFNLFSLIFCLCIVLLMSCDPVDNRLKFLNLSRDSIVVQISNDSLNFPFNNYAFYETTIISPDSTLKISKMGSDHAMEDYINEGQSKRLFAVVFQIDTINKYQHSMTLDSLLKKKKYNDLSSYSIKELTQHNWIISYKKVGNK